MKKAKFIILFAIFLTIALSTTPAVVPQVGTYTFHGAAGNEKILKVRTVNNASLEDLFGSNWTDVIAFFGEGADQVGAQSKSVVTAVNFTDKWDLSLWGLGILDICNYTTDNWGYTTGEFSDTPDSTGDTVFSFYDPTNLTAYINLLYSLTPPLYTAFNVSIQNAGIYLAQLPTPVAQYLGAIVWYSQKWQNVDNKVEHTPDAGDYIFGTYTQYLEDCTETWTYDATYGAWIGYKIEDNESNVIYEFSIELPGAIPGYEFSLFLGITAVCMIGLIYTSLKKKK